MIEVTDEEEDYNFDLVSVAAAIMDVPVEEIDRVELLRDGRCLVYLVRDDAETFKA